MPNEVFISALLSINVDGATVGVLRAVVDGKIIPLYHEDILAKYDKKLFISHGKILPS